MYLIIYMKFNNIFLFNLFIYLFLYLSYLIIYLKIYLKYKLLKFDEQEYKYLPYDLQGPIANYLQNPRMRAVRDSANRAGKSPTALLGLHTALRDAICDNFVAVKILTVVI